MLISPIMVQRRYSTYTIPEYVTGKNTTERKELFSQRVLLPQEQVGINSSWNVVSLESRRKLPTASEVTPWKTLSKKSSAREIWLQWSYLAYEKYPITFSWVLQCLTQGCSAGKVFQRGIEPSSSQPSNTRCLGANLLPPCIHLASSVCDGIVAEEDDEKIKEQLFCDTVIFEKLYECYRFFEADIPSVVLSSIVLSREPRHHAFITLTGICSDNEGDAALSWSVYPRSQWSTQALSAQPPMVSATQCSTAAVAHTAPHHCYRISPAELGQKHKLT